MKIFSRSVPSSEKFTEPTSGTEFVNQWDKPPNEKVLIEGDKEFPDIHSRQRHFIGVMVDACILLHIYEQLKEGASIQLKDGKVLGALKDYFPGGVTPEEAAILVKSKDEFRLSEGEIQKRDEDRLNLLIAMSKEVPGERGVRRILNKHLLVDQQAWESGKEKAAKYDLNLAESQKGLAAAWSNRPEDPRILAVDGYIDSTITILDPGPKSIDSINRKKAEKKSGASDLRDLNRCALVPKKLSYQEDFERIMGLLYPPKNVEDGQKISQTFAEPWESFSNGYFSKKMIIAIDRSNVRGENGEMLTMEGNRAAFAEVKFVTPHMERAERPTGILKGLIKDLDKSSLYTREGTEKRRKDLEVSYRKAKREYDMLLTPEEQKTLAFPPFVFEARKDRDDAYSDLHGQLTALRDKFDSSDERIQQIVEAFEPLLSKLPAPSSFETQVNKLSRFVMSDALSRPQKREFANALNAVTGSDVTLETLSAERVKTAVTDYCAGNQSSENLEQLLQKVGNALIDGNPLQTYKLKSPSLYTKDGMKQRRENLASNYKLTEAEYLAHLSEEERKNKDYKLPPFSSIFDNMDNKDVYENLGRKLTNIQVVLHSNAMALEGKEERTMYLQTSLKQNMKREDKGKSPTGFKRDAAKLQDVDTDREDLIPSPILEKVARGDPNQPPVNVTIDLKVIESSMKAYVNQTAWRARNS